MSWRSQRQPRWDREELEKENVLDGTPPAHPPRGIWRSQGAMCALPPATPYTKCTPPQPSAFSAVRRTPFTPQTLPDDDDDDVAFGMVEASPPPQHQPLTTFPTACRAGSTGLDTMLELSPCATPCYASSKVDLSQDVSPPKGPYPAATPLTSHTRKGSGVVSSLHAQARSLVHRGDELVARASSFSAFERSPISPVRKDETPRIESYGDYRGRRNEDRKYEDRKYEDRRNEDRKNEDRRNEDRKYEGRRNEDRKNEDRRNEDRKYEGRRNEDRKYEDRKNEDRRSEDKKHEDRRNEDWRSEGWRSDGRGVEQPAAYTCTYQSGASVFGGSHQDPAAEDSSEEQSVWERNRELSEENSRLLKWNTDLQAQLSELTDAMQSQQSSVERDAKEVVRLEQKLRHSSQTCDSLRERLRSLASQQEAREADYERRIKALENGSETSPLRRYEQHIIDLEEALADRTRQAEEEAARAEQHEQSLRLLERELELVDRGDREGESQRLAEQERRIEELERELDEMARHAPSEGDQAERVRELEEMLETQMVYAGEQKQALEDKVEQYEQDIADLHRELLALQNSGADRGSPQGGSKGDGAQLAKLEAANAQLQLLADELRTQLAEEQRAYEMAEEEKAKMEDEFCAALAEKEAEIEELSRQRDETDDKVRWFQEKIEELTASTQDLREAHNHQQSVHEDEVARLKDALLEKDFELQNFRNKKETEADSTSAKFAALKRELVEVKNELSEWQRRYRELVRSMPGGGEDPDDFFARQQHSLNVTIAQALSDCLWLTRVVSNAVRGMPVDDEIHYGNKEAEVDKRYRIEGLSSSEAAGKLQDAVKELLCEVMDGLSSRDTRVVESGCGVQ